MYRLLFALIVSVAGSAQAQIYRCEDANGVIEYSNKAGSGKERNCRSVELPTITTIPAPKGPPARQTGSAPPRAGTAAPANGSTRIDGETQRGRDTDRRRIIEDELRKEESRLGELRRDYREGEPERQGDERNYQKYLDRVQRMKEDIARSESNIDSLKKELGALR